MKRRTVVALAGLAISVGAVLMVAQLVDVGTTVSILQRTQPLPLLIVVVLIAASVTLRAIRWSRLLHRPNGSVVPPMRLLPILLVGYLGNIVLPARLGEVVRAYLAARRESVEFGRALGTVLLERVIDVASLSVVGAAVAVAAGAPGWIVQGSILVAAVGMAVTFVLVFVGVGRAA
ncbi:MAG TPA: lysylphosphatidylglycerol synthase transmembrane domain-containing protein, partial [Candidatus Caenarcaniphilales bacterium]|nr:lysylphosphatidylglycerol synthase transmembrane domain-containing protein [Candidatus Caenarcaniphilales bacterium]